MSRLRKHSSTDILDIVKLSFIFLFIIWVCASWWTHVIVCIQNKEWLFLIAGAIMVPISWVHGTGVWFGVW